MMIRSFALLALSTIIRSVYCEFECKCTPTSSCWPSDADFSSFNASLSGALIRGVPPGSVCYTDQPNYNQSLCNTAIDQWTNSTWHASDPVSIDYTYWANNSCNPIYPNGTDVNGNSNAGKAGCSIGNYPAYVVNATCAEQVATAMKWAGEKNIRVIVKNTGHNFLGRSTGYGSLSIWTHNLRGIEYVPDFKPTSCSVNETWRAMRLGAGETGIDALRQAVNHEAVIVTGGNTDVGLSGWMTGGGHGFLSSEYGMGADNLLEATIVTPSGEVLLANPCQNQDLFYATRGGGGGTFGVLTSAVVRAYPTLKTTEYDFNVTLLDPSNSDKYWDFMGYIHAEMPRLKEAGISGYYFIYGPPLVPTYLFQWEVYFYNKPNGTIDSLMQPIIAHLNNQSSIFSYSQQTTQFENYFDAYSLRMPEGVGAPAATMGSRLLSADSLSDPARTAQVLSNIGPSANANTALVFSGSITASNEIPSYYPDLISMTPAWRNTTSHLALISVWNETLDQASVDDIFHDLTWNKTQQLRDLSPDTGAYLNECDYFEPNWQESLYGGSYPRLYEIKQKYDPNGTLWCERCVGSEAWAQMEDGTLCRPFGY